MYALWIEASTCFIPADQSHELRKIYIQQISSIKRSIDVSSFLILYRNIKGHSSATQMLKCQDKIIITKYKRLK